MTKTIAVEVARRGVTVNAIAPGLIETDMTADLDGDAARARCPRGAPGAPEEVAACARFLASEQAGYVTGSTLYVDGGPRRIGVATCRPDEIELPGIRESSQRHRQPTAKGASMSTAVTEEQIEQVVVESLESFGAEPEQITPRGDPRGARHRLARSRRALADRRGALRRRAEGLGRRRGQDGRRRDHADRGACVGAMEPVVVTGVGAVTPLGVGARVLHERWSAGACGIRDGEGAVRGLRRRATSSRPRRRAAPTASPSWRSAACAEALADAGWERWSCPYAARARSAACSAPGSAASRRSSTARTRCANAAPSASRRCRCR